MRSPKSLDVALRIFSLFFTASKMQGGSYHSFQDHGKEYLLTFYQSRITAMGSLKCSTFPSSPSASKPHIFSSQYFTNTILRSLKSSAWHYLVFFAFGAKPNFFFRVVVLAPLIIKSNAIHMWMMLGEHWLVVLFLTVLCRYFRLFPHQLCHLPNTSDPKGSRR
jgi:hypothetical protein